jgi:guanylate kinase
MKPIINYLDANALGFIFVGPSGSGKSTLRDYLLNKDINGHTFVQYKAHTSRKQRPAGDNDYIFVSDNDLDIIESNSEILFRNEYHGNKFLTTWPKKIHDNQHYLYIYSPSGAKRIRDSFPNHKIIQILPDTKHDLRTTLLERDPNITEIELNRRLEIIPAEIAEGSKIADAVFVNNTGVDESSNKLAELIKAFLSS